MTSTDDLLTKLRSLAHHSETRGGRVDMVDLFRDLDDHLSAGGTPPEAWREGPDAPTGHKDAIFRAADILGMDPADLTARLLDPVSEDMTSADDREPVVTWHPGADR